MQKRAIVKTLAAILIIGPWFFRAVDWISRWDTLRQHVGDVRVMWLYLGTWYGNAALTVIGFVLLLVLHKFDKPHSEPLHRQRLLTEDEWKYFTRWEHVHQHSFLNEEVVIDRKFFDHCTFTNVSLVFNGMGPVKIESPVWKGSLAFKSRSQAVITAGHMMELVAAIGRATGASMMVGRGDEYGNIKPIVIGVKKLP